MTTLNSFIRSASAAARRAERSHQRHLRETARLYKQQQKLEALENAIHAVETYENYIDVLLSVHKDASDTVDWLDIKNEEPPIAPLVSNNSEQNAKVAIESYVPSFWDKLFGRVTKKKQGLAANLAYAIEQDKSIYRNQLSQFDQKKQEWELLQRLSVGVLSKDLNSYKDALEYFNPFSDINELGSKLTMQIYQEYLVVNLHVNDKSVIPDYIVSRTSTGKLSKKNMPISRFNELYQDYICSCVLRIARESIAHLPLKFTIVNAIGNLLNKATGKVEEQAILSVAVYPETLDYINFESIDPSDSMSNFIHNMKFSKTNGFISIEALDGATLLEQ